VEYPVDKSIHALFGEQVERHPEKIVVTGMAHGTYHYNRGEAPNTTEESEPGAAPEVTYCELTYRELDEITDNQAQNLQAQGVGEGQQVGILVDRTVEMIIGQLSILKTGSAYVPLNPKAPVERNKQMLAECRVNRLLTVGAMTGKAGEIAAGRSIIYLEKKYNESETKAVQPLKYVNPANYAYVIFTSGSTGKPKGVPITHSNLTPLLQWGQKEMGIGRKDRVIQNLSYYFDGSVWEIFVSLTTGAALYMMSDEQQMNPEASVAFISANKITTILATPTQWQYMLPTQGGSIKKDAFKSLNKLCIGAEKLTLDLVKRVIGLAAEKCRIFNMYGPTEAAIISAVLEIDKTTVEKYKHQSSVPIGKPIANADLLILDKHMKPVPLQVEGELCIGGDGVAHGYLNNQELTAERFVPSSFPNNQYPITNNNLYRTGDRARWQPDGTVEFLGRLDFQVKIRGFRIELGEIENHILAHENVKETIVVAKEDNNGDNYLCAYVISKTKRRLGGQDDKENLEIVAGAETELADGLAELRESLYQTLPDYMVPSYFVPIEVLPLNPNGKVDLKALPEPQAAGKGNEYIAPRNRMEEKLAEIWAGVLTVEKERIGITGNFFQLGGHSLKATLLTARIQKEFDVKLPLAQLFKNPRIRDIAGYIKNAAKKKFTAIEPAAKKEYYALSSAQKRLYILQQLDENSTGYNMCEMVQLEGELDSEKMEQTIKQLIHRHESLRTTFRMEEGEPVQKIETKVDFKIRNLGQGKEEHEIKQMTQTFVRPFRLTEAPLLRVGIIKNADETVTAKTQHILMVDMHHIISDGVSIQVLLNDFKRLYEGGGLPPVKIHYKDYAG
ncbi:MAG: amino acid adenylation domain-containing protein, partial [bacterium]|nr:amino acid adenylation domain-containing protein [bacterium]